MKKSFFIVATVCFLIALLCVPCFAAESTAAPSDPVDWFGGGVSSYTLSFSNLSSTDADLTAWLSAMGATSSDTAIGGFSYSTATNQYAYVSSQSGSIVYGTPGYAFGPVSYSVSLSYISSDTTGLTEAQAISGATVSTVGSEGFVDAGFSDALIELSTIVSAILSNQYILIAIGLAVAVPLVAWGISKIKSLVKGY